MESCVSLGESELNGPISGPQQVGFAARIVCEDNFLTSCLGLMEGRRVSSVFNAGYPHQRQVQVDDLDLGEIRMDVQRSRSNTLTEARGLPIRHR